MSDDPILSALGRLEAGQADVSDRLGRLEAGQADVSDRLGRLEASVARMDAEQTRLREQLNSKLDDILDKQSANRTDIHTVTGHVLYALESNLTLSRRITKIEEELRRRS